MHGFAQLPLCSDYNGVNEVNGMLRIDPSSNYIGMNDASDDDYVQGLGCVCEIDLPYVNPCKVSENSALADADSDGIGNDCDKCAGTTSGSTVDDAGCSKKQGARL